VGSRGVGEGRAIPGRDERGLPAILSLTPLELEVRKYRKVVGK